MGAVNSCKKKDINKIVVIRSKNMEEFEEKIIENSKKYEIIKTDFGTTEDYFWFRMYCT